MARVGHSVEVGGKFSVGAESVQTFRTLRPPDLEELGDLEKEGGNYDRVGENLEQSELKAVTLEKFIRAVAILAENTVN